MNTKNNLQRWSGKDGQIYDQHTGRTLGLICYFDENNENHKKYQKLMAAAPYLLETLKNILEDIEYSKDEIPIGAIGKKQIREAILAIHEAEGE